jgi:hypothetical protein
VAAARQPWRPRWHGDPHGGSAIAIEAATQGPSIRRRSSGPPSGRTGAVQAEVGWEWSTRFKGPPRAAVEVADELKYLPYNQTELLPWQGRRWLPGPRSFDCGRRWNWLGMGKNTGFYGCGSFTAFVSLRVASILNRVVLRFVWAGGAAVAEDCWGAGAVGEILLGCSNSTSWGSSFYSKCTALVVYIFCTNVQMYCAFKNYSTNGWI